MSDRNLRLDSLRGVAASIVVFHHAINLCDLGLADRAFLRFASADLTGRALLSFLSGGMAVNIFFVLSGAVLAASLMRESSFNAMTAIKFIVRRVLRIYPALIVSVLTMAVAGYVVSGPGMIRHSLSEIIENCLLVGYNVNGATWTLQIEMLLVPIILAVAFFTRFFGMLAVVAFLCFGVYCIFQGTPFGLSVLNVPMLCFALGMIIPSQITRHTFENPPSWLWWSSLLLMIPARYFLPFDSTPALIMTISLGYCAVSALYYSGKERTILDHPALRFMGKISYSLYLNHVIVIYGMLFPLVLLPIFGNTFITANYIPFGLAFGAVALAITIPIAALSEAYLERPFMRIGKKKPQAVQVAPVEQPAE